MSGKSHFVLGCTTAVAIAYLGLKDNNASQVVMALTVPFGAMLPDIDHDRTKLGRKRLEIVTWAKRAIAAVCIAYVVNLLYLIIVKGADPMYTIIGSVTSVGPIALCILVASNPMFKNKTKFFRKHRGIMHTLFPIAGMLIGAHMLRGGFMSMLLIGVSIGYVTHLIADQETVMGNPLLWPLTDKNIPGLPVKAGSHLELLVLLLDMGVIACLVMWYSSH